MGGNPDQRRSDGTGPDLATRPESDSQLWLPRPGDSRAGTRLARLNSALEPSIFQPLDPPRASADTNRLEPVGPRRVVTPWIDDFADTDQKAESDNILVAMWSDGERQGWFVLSLVLLASLVALIGYSTAHPPARDLFGTVTGDRFASTEMLKPGTSTNASAFEPPSQAVSERNTQESPLPGDQEVIWRRSLPVALGMLWLIGAWIIDREARRALVIREPWGERRTIAYGMIAIVVVLPLMIAGIMISAWGVVQALVEIQRVYGAQTAVRAAGGFILAIVTILILREPVGRLTRWATQMLKPAASQVARNAVGQSPRDRTLPRRNAPWVPRSLRHVSIGSRWRS
jgi:hypothetical protein